jgi:predicted phage terminase large subunit-like protein
MTAIPSFLDVALGLLYPEPRHDPWDDLAREEQRPPQGDWLVWLLVTGRRWGKTRTAAEWLRKRALDTPGTYAICAPTYADARDVCVEGGSPGKPSGFLSVCQEGEVELYNRSLGEIRMVNGSKVKLLSADEPDRARGWGFHAAWCDEMSSWRYPETWYLTLLPAVTMDDRHRFVITTTPKTNQLTRDLLKQAESDPAVHLTRGRTIDNAANLGAGVVEELERQMTQRRIRQELYGELLEDVEGALWTLEMIDRYRLGSKLEHGIAQGLAKVVVGVDPAATSTDEADETGIVVAGKGNDGRGYVLDDRSCRASPNDWGRRAIQAYRDHEADLIVAEANNGGEMVAHVLKTVDARVPVRMVHASRGKRVRAEPVAALYEQGKVSHIGGFSELEDQLTSWVPDSGESPDRMDALVWAMAELFPFHDRGDVSRKRYRDRRLVGR